MVGISNDLTFKEKLDPRVISSLGEEEIVFTNYNVEQIKKILEERINESFIEDAVEEPALNLCAALAGGEHGDARRAIDLLRVSTLRAEMSQSSCIEIEHIQSAHKQVEHERVIGLLQGLPLHQKLTLTSIIINERNGILTQTTGTIWETYVQACNLAGMKPLTSRSVSSIINGFHSASLAHVKNVSLGRRGRTKHVSSLIPRGIDAIGIMRENNDAVNLGTKFAENIVGEDACISKDCSMWLENLNQRTHLEGGRNNTWNGTKAAKYNNYVIYNNLILFCPGYDENDSMKNCTIFIDKLEEAENN